MNHLTRNDYAQALAVLARLESSCGDAQSFASAAVRALGEFVASDLVTLSVCRPGDGSYDGHGSGIERAVAVPLFSDGHTLVRIVLNRRAVDFGARDCERLELLRPHLAFLYREACRAGERAARAAGGAGVAVAPPMVRSMPDALTAREREVLRWLAGGKTDAEIGALLSISVRTVQKHLEHVYVKLGVETRTAAVMRALGDRPHPAAAVA